MLNPDPPQRPVNHSNNALPFDPHSLRGLSAAEVLERRAAEGLNELPTSKKRGVLAIAMSVAREPMFLLLIACGAIYLMTEDDKSNAFMLLGFVIVIMGITFYQERKTERALEALRDLSSPRALVIRDGEQQRIPGREVVRDDLIILNEGDRVPADGVLLWGNNLVADESLLTGESVPVRKLAAEGAVEMARPGGEDQPFVYSGTMIVQGQGVAEARATGSRAEIGRIGKALRSLEPEETVLQGEIRRLVRNVAIFAAALCALVFVVYALTRHDWTHALLAGLTLAMAMLPEEFPVVLTIFLALGAWRISRKGVLTRRVPAVENLGSAGVLCVDKTGTLTTNRMSVRKIFAEGEFYDVSLNHMEPLPEAFHSLVEFSMLASQIDPFDPMEKALKAMGERALSNTEHIHRDWALVQEYPLSKQLLAMSRVWKSSDGREYVIAAKGAPEAIADLCHLDKARLDELVARVGDLADEGLRVIGVARACFDATQLPDAQHDFRFEFVGLLGFADPVRPGVMEAIKECRDAGIRVVMITGDYPGTARNIAAEIGLRPLDEIITGQELDRMDDAELRRRIRTAAIFARVVPEQKLRLVNALKANGEVVAMTGDGVNDAPALKAANIGIAMGGRGSDVARESAALVLVDDAFPSIVEGIKMGRRVFDNLKKAMAYIFAVHLPIAGMSLIPTFLNWELVLLPVHILFLELIIDPACSIVFESEPEERGVMKRPPRDLREPLFSGKTVLLSTLQGMAVFAIVLAVYVFAIHVWGKTADEARALSFTTLIVANLGLILTNLSLTRTAWATLRSRNRALWWVVGAAIVFLGLVLNVPVLRGLFHFDVLSATDVLICLGAGAVSVAWFEVLKVVNARRRTQPTH